MSRRIYCRPCGDKVKRMHPEDKKMGFQQRLTFISAVTPQGHGITVNGVFTPLAEVQCDSCGEAITGSIVVAKTMWRGEENEIGNWEHEYGKVLTPEAVALADKLSGKEQPK